MSKDHQSKEEEVCDHKTPEARKEAEDELAKHGLSREQLHVAHIGNIRGLSSAVEQLETKLAILTGVVIGLGSHIDIDSEVMMSILKESTKTVLGDAVEEFGMDDIPDDLPEEVKKEIAEVLGEVMSELVTPPTKH